MKFQKRLAQRRERKRHRVRNRVRGTAERPRLSVFRSSMHIYAQIIDDSTGVTLAAYSSAAKDLKSSVGYGGNVKAATTVGTKLAEVAKAKGVTKVCFDRGHYKFHGRVKALAEAVRAGGIQF
ncbi:MAG: 50S ribosomal protein L18 [Gemmataceae bacterium]|nr:50S ribosomal protein L18 [Gemmataceae bacterium]